MLRLLRITNVSEFWKLTSLSLHVLIFSVFIHITIMLNSMLIKVTKDLRIYNIMRSVMHETGLSTVRQLRAYGYKVYKAKSDGYSYYCTVKTTLLF